MTQSLLMSGKRIAGTLAVLGAVILPCSSLQAAPVADARLTFSGQVAVEKPHRFADVILTGDVITSTLTLNVPAEDAGKTADLYLVAIIREGSGKRLYMQVGNKWLTWSGRVADLLPVRRKVLAATESYSVLTAEPLFEGDYQVFAGYQVPGASLRYMPAAYRFGVQEAASEALVKFSSDAAMRDYIRSGMQAASADQSYYRKDFFVSQLADVALPSVSGAASLAESGVSSRTSGTNLQEVGIDESDTIKASGDLLFMLASCKEGGCLQVQRLNSSTASAQLVASYAFKQDEVPDSLYLVEGSSAGENTIVTLANKGSYGGWFRIWDWGQNSTNLEFLQVDDSLNITQSDSLAIDGALVSSRRVGDTLYLVTRYSPVIPGYLPYAFDEKTEASNTTLLESATLPALLPAVKTSTEDLLALVQSKDCYLPTSAVDGGRDPSIITITTIDLHAPANFNSTCFLGGSEALYMTADSLYLATTSWNYQTLASDALVYSNEHTTSIHKFALANGGVEYRGSGAVKGHLGWSDDKKSFRMGENGEFLNVATSIGDTWDGSSSTRLSVLREAAGGSKLETVNVIDGIGKPGEQLYAARFLGNRAYLVTFRLTDPLYVLDLSDQASPRIAGELEIEGYSEYLHPVSDTLLLGIGKEAIADTRTSDLGDGRGAWYQGVKVALFDVADISKPAEIASVEIGKRGTESDVLWDHHAFSFLPATANEPARFAIPVQLHDKVPAWEGFDPAMPNAWYDYTHTALYSFEASAQGLGKAGVLISEVAQDRADPVLNDWVVLEPGTKSNGDAIANPAVAEPDADDKLTLLPVDPGFAPYYVYYSDRSVLMDDAVFYVHGGKVLGAFWGESKELAPQAP